MNYSLVYYYIYKWIKDTIELRKMDIANRLNKK